MPLMNKDIQPQKKAGNFSLRGLSIRQRLPLQICALLLCIIIGFSFASYYTVKKAVLEMGRERLRSVTNQLASILSQSTASLITSIKTSAGNDTIRQCLASGGKEFHIEVLDALKRLRKDSTTALLELVDSNYLSVLSYSEEKEDLRKKLSSISESDSLFVGPNSSMVGKIYAIDTSMYFPVIAQVTDKKQIIGYLVSWRLLTTTPRAIEQLSQLMGKDAVLYIGNTDGGLWTDMMKPVSNPPITITEINKYFEFSDPKGNDVIAAAQLITNSKWVVLIEFSKQTILEGANRILKWIIIIGLLLIAAGIFIARVMSNNITKPLKQLTEATTAISKEDYSLRVKVDKNNELGKLANAFNMMAEQVESTHLNLEKKVSERTAQLSERTAQLESVNKELEAFSYSVSHDLRAPLRGIIGFSTILEEEFASKMDDEAKRITAIIKNNTLKMGNLIDDLLSFSKMGRQQIVKTKVEMNEMVNEIVTESGIKNDRIKWAIGSLPVVHADQNTIRQVWINLISNAIKYSGKNKHPKIEIGSFKQGNETVFFVKDNGVGFDEKYKEKLFRVFQRLHRATEFEGTGVGLAIVDKIISKHGGKVWAEAAVDKGASFYFSLSHE